jgi:hypothetical protein
MLRLHMPAQQQAAPSAETCFVPLPQALAASPCAVPAGVYLACAGNAAAAAMVRAAAAHDERVVDVVLDCWCAPVSSGPALPAALGWS